MTAPVEAVSGSLIPATRLDSAPGTTAGAPDFAGWLNQQISQVNERLIDADQQVRKLAVGDAENLHQVMISLEKAKMSFELMLQVRNRMLEAYQDIMRMQL